MVRKRLLGLPETARAPRAAYAPARSERVYTTLGTQAAAAVRTTGGAIVDATFGTTAARAAFTRGLDACGAPVLVAECRAPAALLEARAAARARGAKGASDATPAVVRRHLAAWEPLVEIPSHRHLLVSTERPPEAVADHVLGWLDRRLEARA